ncbi:hypothetical protein PHYBLDRAFT_74178 [Phycomyces blakesleeanus NRRL 1555(-)]|uniref:Reverse transcriptase zinc-binding domain-containing protein n=1 Tax=Phycomyces blakesleeanus (strain ATCC 8743b / DSM 1359 / FGSC 10004 / NBRC 33097 / NRRL 1555) TaxID=763407 RepID=A0A167QM27_PHYB8|nr:hypothetical protein PHYBLDRAFT_74178 [Phycomyces blakesleeanus NRRL 1555(-)]OAD79907.1 hypothetical protein PHYBLDRAFT_74178 [Phycomyces blakesleeanus NRRL 1555(-)]|eukprot:XP_018297947.1 hypothetical protein PHYBLDRAFT_74178 [Phycomyces blakesleeanus NRRL 1555(-)]
MLWDRTPARKRLNLFIPRRFPSSSCIFCQDATEDQYHFFFGCSIKRQVWNVILSRFCPAWNLAEICLLLTRGSFPPRSSHQGLWIILSAVTAKAIWSAHWKFVFDDQPFLSGVVAQKASTVIEKHIEFIIRITLVSRIPKKGQFKMSYLRLLEEKPTLYLV